MTQDEEETNGWRNKADTF